MTPHPQADLLRAIADGEQMQLENFEGTEFVTTSANNALCGIANGYRVRIAPKMRSITVFEYQEPVTEPLENDDVYYAVGVYVTRDQWTRHPVDYMRLKAHAIHLTEEAAKAHRIAIIKAGGGEV